MLLLALRCELCSWTMYVFGTCLHGQIEESYNLFQRNKKQNYLAINGLSFRLASYMRLHIHVDGVQNWPLWEMRRRTEKEQCDGWKRRQFIWWSHFYCWKVQWVSRKYRSTCVIQAQWPMLKLRHQYNGRMWMGRRWTADVPNHSNAQFYYVSCILPDWLRLSFLFSFLSTCSLVRIARISFQRQTSFSYSQVFWWECTWLPEQKNRNSKKVYG